jgi:hypothetical protein
MNKKLQVALMCICVISAIALTSQLTGQVNNGTDDTEKERLGMLAAYARPKNPTELEWKVLQFNSEWYFHSKPFDYVSFGPLVAMKKGPPLGGFAMVIDEPLVGTRRFSSLDRWTQEGKIMAACRHYMSWLGAKFPEIHEDASLVNISIVRSVEDEPVVIGRFENGMVILEEVPQ